MNPVKISAVLLVALLFSLPLLGADSIIAIPASGECDLDGATVLTNAHRQTALADARRKALKIYVDQLKGDPQTEARANLIYSKGLLDVMHLKLTDYTPEATVVREEVQAGVYRAFCAVKVSVSQIQALLDKAGTMVSQTLTDEMLAFLVVAREVDAVKTFKPRDVSQESRNRSAQDDTGREATARAEGDDTQERVTVTENQVEEVRVETGGSVEQKSEKVLYRRCDISLLESRFSEVFTTAGIEIISSEDLAALIPETADPEADRAAFAEDGDGIIFVEEPVTGLSASFASDRGFSARQEFFKAAACKAGCRWFGLARMTAGREEINPQTGETEVAVAVDVYLAQLQTLGKTDRLIYKKVASRVQTLRGSGTNAEEARNNGLLVAGRFAAQNMIDQIRAVVTKKAGQP